MARRRRSRLAARLAAIAIAMSAVLMPHISVATSRLAVKAIPLGTLQLADRGEMSRVPIRLTVTGSVVGPLIVGRPNNAAGQPAREVVSFFEGLLGPPTNISTFQDRVIAGCFGGEVFVQYSWPGVFLGFSGPQASDRGSDRWTNFRFDDRAQTDLLLGVSSTRGATIGDSLDVWLDLHPDARVFEGDPIDDINTTMELSDGLIAELTTDDNGVLVVRTLSGLPPLYCE